MDITGLSLALGSSFTTGLNLYLTLFSLGMMQRLDVFTLGTAYPDGLHNGLH